MGGRGSASGATGGVRATTQAAQTAQAVTPQNAGATIATIQTAPTPKSTSGAFIGGTPTGANGTITPPQQSVQTMAKPDFIGKGLYSYKFGTLKNLSDDDMLKVLKTASNVDMPNHLADRPDMTQRFVYTLGFNEAPEVLDKQAFAAYRKQNNISSNEILARSVNRGTYRTTAGSNRSLSDAQIAQMWISDPYNYIGGKHGGQALGAGAYFDQRTGNTGYGSMTYRAVLNPKTARVATTSTINNAYNKWAATHPKSHAEIMRQARGSASWGYSDLSVKALIMGYNVIKGSGGYHNVILRDATVVEG